MFKKILCLGLLLMLIPLCMPQSSLSRAFFVNIENGQPRVKVVYGAYAAEEDYENALDIAEHIANRLCVVISETPQYFWLPPSDGSAPSNTEVVITPDIYGYLWYSGKSRYIYGTTGYDESKVHEEIRLKADLESRTILYVKYMVKNIEKDDYIWFLGNQYHVTNIQEDRLTHDGGEIISSIDMPYWYNTLWFLKVYDDRIELYMENIPMKTSNQLTTPSVVLENDDIWIFNIKTEWQNDVEFGYQVRCGISYKLDTVERTKEPIGVDPESMLVKDTEITRDMKLEYNLILVGGPGQVIQSTGGTKTANRITEEVILSGYSQVNWYVTLGKYEYVERAFSDKGVVIVAGNDREATTTATESFLDKIEELA
jgi:hypothetical protein